MRASNANSAATFVSAIHISCNARLAFGCWLFGNLASTFAVLCTQQRCSRVLGQTSPAAFQNPSAPSAMTSRGGASSPRRFRSSSRSRQRWRRREAAGNMIIVRYADDLIVGFEHETDARRFLDEMRKRLQEVALSLHSEKTRLIEFGRFAAENRKRRGLGKPETFTFLGFIFICSKTRRGKFQINRKSRRDRMQAKLQAIKQELRPSMHQPIPQQGRWLQQGVTRQFKQPTGADNGPAPHT